MKKFLIAASAVILVLTIGTTSAQIQHNVTVSIPEVVTIRFTDGNSRAPVTTNLNLAFTITGDAADFADSYAASNLSTRGWADIQVFQNRESSWDVTVEVTGDAGFDWSKIVVTPTGTNAIATGFDLTADGLEIAAHDYPNAASRGWNSLGFGPGDFELTLDGTEDAGDFTATVVYTLSAP